MRSNTDWQTGSSGTGGLRPVRCNRTNSCRSRSPRSSTSIRRSAGHSRRGRPTSSIPLYTLTGFATSSIARNFAPTNLVARITPSAGNHLRCPRGFRHEARQDARCQCHHLVAPGSVVHRRDLFQDQRARPGNVQQQPDPGPVRVGQAGPRSFSQRDDQL